MAPVACGARAHGPHNAEKAYGTDYNAESKNQNTLISATWRGSHAGNKTFSASDPRCSISRETRATFDRTLAATVYVSIRSLFTEPAFLLRFTSACRFIYLNKPAGSRVSPGVFICAAKWPFSGRGGQVDHCSNQTPASSLPLDTPRRRATSITRAFERFLILFDD